MQVLVLMHIKMFRPIKYSHHLVSNTPVIFYTFRVGGEYCGDYKWFFNNRNGRRAMFHQSVCKWHIELKEDREGLGPKWQRHTGRDKYSNQTQTDKVAHGLNKLQRIHYLTDINKQVLNIQEQIYSETGQDMLLKGNKKVGIKIRKVWGFFAS